MAAYRRVYDSRHLQADCREPGSAPEPYARQSSTGYLYLSADTTCMRRIRRRLLRVHRFCVGDRYYLCDNKILCEYDYEERLV